MISNQKKNNQYSTYFLLFFVICILFLLTVSELLKSSNSQNSQLVSIENPIRADIIANIKTIKLKNSLGSYTLTKNKSSWLLKEPRLMPANRETIDLILKSLKSITTKRTIEKDPINMNNFALENPNLTIDIFSELDEQLKIQIGLINPINNTSYITVSGKDKIYQINAFDLPIQSYELSNFIDSSIFSLKLADIEDFKIYNREFKDPINTLSRTITNWKSKKYKSITKESVDKKLKKIINIKTHMIIDKQDSNLKTVIDNYLDRPLYKIKIKTKQGKIEYKVSSLVKSLPKLKLEKRQFFLMKASDRDYTYVIQKKFLNEFYIRYTDLK